MANRTTIIGGIWAENAPNPPTGTPPAADTTYANANLTEETIQMGLPHAKVVDSADLNELLRRTTTLLGLLETYGTLPFCASVTYPEGAQVMGSDGKIYFSLDDDNLSHDPTVSPEYWELEYSQLLDDPGYRISRGGMIDQWGSSTVLHTTPGYGILNSQSFSITFPIEFPNRCLHVMVLAGDMGWTANDTAEHTYTAYNVTTSGFTCSITRLSGETSADDYTHVQYRAYGY